MFGYVAEESLRSYVLSRLPGEQVKAHVEGWVHIHDLPYSLFIGYCAGWSIAKLLRIGLMTPTISARPAKHLDSAVDHVANFLMSAQHEWAGAQAFSQVDLYLAPFVRYDGLSGKHVAIKQALQRLVYNLNLPSRVGAQTPFTNFTLLLDTVERILEEDEGYVGGKPVGPLGQYLDEALQVFEALCNVLMEGDAGGRPFTFPIPTIMVTDSFDWTGRRWGEVSEKIFKLAAKRGSFYWLNARSGIIDPAATFAMCCRLTVNKTRVLSIAREAFKTGSSFRLGELSKALEEQHEELEKMRGRHLGGVWAIPDETGSIAVVTLNLPRLGFLAKGEWDKLEEMLDYYLELAREHLMLKRRILESILAQSLYDLPITRRYLGTYMYHYNTIGVIGLPEFAANMIRNPMVWREPSKSSLRDAINAAKKVLQMIHERIKEFEERDEVIYNVEEVPGEGASYRLARADHKMFAEYVEKGEFALPMSILGGGSIPFYSNSIVPYYAEVPLWIRVELEAEVQPLFTGGVMMHIFLHQQPDPRALRRLVEKITSTRVVYFSITPTISVCRSCHRNTVGVHKKCPYCGSESVEWWSRIVGYYRPVHSWNIGRRAEFMSRVMYNATGEPVPVGDLLS